MWLIRKILNSCPTCTLKKCKQASQSIGKLPTERVLPSPPFSLVTIDLCGHYWVKQGDITVKIWILIYQCNVSRALYTEVVESYSGSGLVNSLRTMFAVRNIPVRISADPGRNMVKAKGLMAGVPTMSSKDLQ